jgi:hypothetical protein
MPAARLTNVREGDRGQHAQVVAPGGVASDWRSVFKRGEPRTIPKTRTFGTKS